MPSWKKLIVSGSNATISSLFVTNQVTGSSFTGSFTGSYSGDGSSLTGITPVGSSNKITFDTDFTTTADTYTSLMGPITLDDGATITVTAGSFLKIEDF
tara:strand:- start:76 stop:372 length:297 start_codon:yes stop_codon:yes gene_type:complete